ncbi:unnamed protein product [Protopolystoma xenopodis]|uniref:Uncharacterized protein n=1 Tax=Protopolystoma xenopodis TaxID=117903 RepID=A0A448XL45_9PLAT|nr:unnamed protein product [Protopolystoma xenopodis]
MNSLSDASNEEIKVSNKCNGSAGACDGTNMNRQTIDHNASNHSTASISDNSEVDFDDSSQSKQDELNQQLYVKALSQANEGTIVTQESEDCPLPELESHELLGCVEKVQLQDHEDENEGDKNSGPQVQERQFLALSNEIANYRMPYKASDNIRLRSLPIQGLDPVELSCGTRTNGASGNTFGITSAASNSRRRTRRRRKRCKGGSRSNISGTNHGGGIFLSSLDVNSSQPTRDSNCATVAITNESLLDSSPQAHIADHNSAMIANIHSYASFHSNQQFKSASELEELMHSHGAFFPEWSRIAGVSTKYF